MAIVSPFYAGLNLVIALFGFLAGVLLVTEKETVKLFLIALVLALVPTYLSTITSIPIFFRQILENIGLLAGMMAIVPAIVGLYKIGKSR